MPAYVATCCSTWSRGARTVIMPGFDPDLFLDLIERERITAVNMVPTMLQMLLEHPQFARIDVSHLRQVIYGASPMPRPVIEQAMATWGADKFWNTTARPNARSPSPCCARKMLGACGRPALDAVIRLVDDQGADVSAGEPGEIAVRAPSMLAGYHNAPDLNAEMFLPEGWLRTRDIGVFDARGFLHLKDRTSDMIITGGYNVYPREIEDVLAAHPAIAECAVIGLADAKWIEAVTAVVALKPGETLDERTLIDFVAAEVASYKKPRRVEFVDAIPKTAVGKLNRKALRDQFAANADSG